MLKNKFQIFTSLIFFLEKMNQSAPSVKKLSCYIFCVKKLELPEIACNLLHFPTFLAVVFNAKLIHFSRLFCIQIIHFGHNLHSEK